MYLAAAGIRFKIQRVAGGFALVVRSADETRARVELDAYERESADDVERLPPEPRVSDGWHGALLYGVVILVVAILGQYHAFDRDWLSAGRMQAGQVRSGQFFRTVTALTLHLDALHLFGNLFFGVLFGLFAGRLLGSGVAWFSILIAGALGNTLNAYIQPAAHSAVGASTGIFAALGILSAYAWKRRGHSERRWFRRLVPIVGGVVLLGFTGAGGERTDVIAHLTGFFCGLIFGVIHALLAYRVRLTNWIQVGFGLASGTLLAGAWWLALKD